MKNTVYALAKLRFRGRTTLFGAVLVCLLIPYQATALPIYILFFSTGILNTYGALVLPFTISVFGIFLMRQFIESLPKELEEAARLDGATTMGVLRGIIFPLATPMLVVLFIYQFLTTWNSFSPSAAPSSTDAANGNSGNCEPVPG